MRDDIKTALERLAVARQSDDLTLKAWACDVDPLIAVAFAAQGLPKGVLAVTNLRYALDARSWAEGLERATALAFGLAFHRVWRLEPGQIKAVAKAALKHHVCPLCTKCAGQKYLVIEGTNRLSGKACPACHATGIQPLPKIHRTQVRDVLTALEADEWRLQDRLRRALR